MLCSSFTMENYQGDLTDIIRNSTTCTDLEAFSYGGSAGASPEFTAGDHFWPELPANFGDPFSTTRDPLFHASTFNFVTHNSPETITGSPGFSGAGDATVTGRPGNMFSRMLQISPSNSPVPGKSPSNGESSKPVCLIENSGLQISSPRNPAIKRRKNQVKKVVCIPAPAPANSRGSSGEIVPSDLWAWRKYGQKPIKGSPFPRGYYRCSSSKGCSARKQVERSRTDPNMLVITYSSDHNHPWPTQRNALAGSTRSHPSSKKPSSLLIKTSSFPKQTLDEDLSSPSMATQNVLEVDEFPFLPLISSSTHCDEDFFQDYFGDMNSVFTTQNEDGSKKKKEEDGIDPFTDLYDWPNTNTFKPDHINHY